MKFWNYTSAYIWLYKSPSWKTKQSLKQNISFSLTTLSSIQFFEGNFCKCPLFGIKTRPQHQELHSLLFTRSTLVLKLSLQTSTEEMQETGKGCRIFAALEKSILTNFPQRQGIGDKLIYINPLTHMSDQDRIYPHNINSISTR